MKMNLRKKILALVVIPSLVIGITALLISNQLLTTSMEEEIELQLKIAAGSGVQFYEFSNQDPFTRDENGTVTKGSLVITDDFRFVDQIYTNNGLQATFFYGDERIVTSIKDKDDQRLIGTKASAPVVETVINQGKEYFAKDVIINGEKYYGYYIPVKDITTDSVIGMFFAGDKASQVNQLLQHFTLIISLSILGILILSIFIALIMVLSITKALDRTISQLNQLSEGNLQFEENKKDMNRQDEIGSIVNATTKLKHSLTKVIRGITETTSVLASSSEGLEQVSKQNSITVDGIDNAIEDIASGAISQAESTEDASKQVMIMGNRIEDTTSAVNTLHLNANEMKESSEEAMQTLQSLQLINQKTKQAIGVIYEQTNENQVFAQKIKEAINVITTIAEETNLLSLNASIEAARAGESGRGFGVVADQIKKLAEQSNQSAKEIEEIIYTLINNSDKAVTSMDEVKEVIGIQNENLDKTKDAFENVYNGIHQSVQSVSQISEITAHLNEVRTTVNDIISNLSAVSEENAASAQETSAAVAELTATMTDVENEVTVLRSLADDLSKSISIFKL